MTGLVLWRKSIIFSNFSIDLTPRSKMIHRMIVSGFLTYFYKLRLKIASFIEKKWHFLFVIVSLFCYGKACSFCKILSLDSGYKYDGTPRSFTYAAGIVYILHNRKTSLIHPKKEALLISSSDEKLNILANE